MELEDDVLLVELEVEDVELELEVLLVELEVEDVDELELVLLVEVVVILVVQQRTISST